MNSTEMIKLANEIYDKLKEKEYDKPSFLNGFYLGYATLVSGVNLEYFQTVVDTQFNPDILKAELKDLVDELKGLTEKL